MPYEIGKEYIVFANPEGDKLAMYGCDDYSVKGESMELLLDALQEGQPD